MQELFKSLLVFLGVIDSTKYCDNLVDQRNAHGLKELSINELSTIHKDSPIVQLRQTFNSINLIRPVGSTEHQEVQKFIKQYLQSLGWSLTSDTFIVDTVIGVRNFTNIIGKSALSAKRSLVLACHYESKLIPGFYGSIDSAVSCAIILEVARVFAQAFRSKQHPDLGLTLIFFDGEEAFRDWTDRDSLYGSRHLAAKWGTEKDSNGCNQLLNLDLFILLDLIGAKHPVIPDFGYAHSRYYELLIRLERKARQNSMLLSSASNGQTYFGYTVQGGIADDHVPFKDRNVPVLHLIPVPFPSQWHQTSDDASNVDWNVAIDFLFLMRAFVSSYFGMVT